MRRERLVLSAASVFLVVALTFSGCRSSQDTIYSQVLFETQSSSAYGDSAAAQDEELSGELTILSVYEFSNLERIAEEFETLHPNVKLNVEVGITSSADLGMAEPWEQFMEQLTTELMSGEGPDILVDPGVFTPKQYQQSGVACDLREWMDADPDFHLEEYYENILQAYEVDGDQYTLPANFWVSVLYLNKELCDAAGVSCSAWDTVDYTEILDIWRAAENQGLLAQDFTLEFMDQKGPSSLFFDAEFPCFVDVKAGTCSFDSPEFIQYLKDTKSIPSNRTLSQGVVTMSGSAIMGDFSRSNQEENHSLLLYDMLSLDSLVSLSEIPENCVGPLILSSREGEVSFSTSLSFVVPTSCSHPELAWEFLKFCVAPVETPAFYSFYHPEGSVDIVQGGFPVAKENLLSYGELYGKANQVMGGSMTIPDDFDPASMDSPFPDGFFTQLESVVSHYRFAIDSLGRVGEIYTPILQQYYDTDTLSAEECARQLQEKVGIWLQE